MNLISIEKLSIAESNKDLLINISFGINLGEKIALVGINGCGKSTLLRTLSGEKKNFEGSISYNKELKISYLHQKIEYNPKNTILEHILGSNGEILTTIREYNELLGNLTHNEDDIEKLNIYTQKMDELEAWDIESRIKSVLGELGINDMNLKMDQLSGGMQKKIALAHCLIQDYNLLLMDEPTNHLDIDTIIWLQEYLKKSPMGLIIVTHDRYFLDNVATKIVEIDEQKIFSYNGNYTYYLEKKQERFEAEQKSQNRLATILRREKEWLKRGPKARTSKDKGRINRAYNMMDQVKSQEIASSDFSVTNRRLGKKILILNNISKSYGENLILNPFSYSFKKGERIGVVGENGSGKTTLLNIINKDTIPDSGYVEQGLNTYIGYFDQMGQTLPMDNTVMGFLKEISPVISLDDGRSLSPAQYLELFLFPKSLFYTQIKDISGGELKRLYLISILLKNPNFLILDEPTNDFDIQTLTLLEDFLENYQGCLVVVSHDRYFLDKTVDFLLILDGHGNITGFAGNYSDFTEYKKNLAIEAQLNKTKGEKEVNRDTKKGLSYKEKLEFNEIEAQIEKIEIRISALEDSFTTETDPIKIKSNSVEYNELSDKLTHLMNRWEVLGEKF